MTKKFQFTKQQEEFIHSDKNIVIFSGAVGAGKSRGICLDAFKKAIEYPGSRILICRDEYRSLSNSTEQTWNQIIPNDKIADHNKSKHRYKVKTLKEDGTFTDDTTSEVWFEGLEIKSGDEYPTKIGSTEFSTIYLDEGHEVAEKTFGFLETRARLTAQHFKTDEKIQHQVKTATNPGGPNHWMKQEFIDKAEPHEDDCVPEMCDDHKPDVHVINVKTTDNEFLDDSVKDKLLDRFPKGSMMYDRLIKGKWVAAEGLVYDNFEPKKHTVNEEEFLDDYSDYKKIVAGADSGWKNPRVVLVMGVTGSGTVHVLDEFYRSKTSVADAVEWLDAKDYDVRKIYHDPSEPEEIEEYGKQGYTCVKAPNDIIPGITEVSKYFAGTDGKDILINKKCTNFTNELLSYRYPEGNSKRGKNRNEDETPIKEDDHAADSLRYCVMGLRSGKDFAFGFV